MEFTTILGLALALGIAGFVLYKVFKHKHSTGTNVTVDSVNKNPVQKRK